MNLFLNSSEIDSLNFISFLNLDNKSVFYLGIFFIVTILITVIIRVSSYYLNSYLSANIGHDLSKAVFIKNIRTDKTDEIKVVELLFAVNFSVG